MTAGTRNHIDEISHRPEQPEHRFLVAALDNERALAISAGDIRMKNFNFFVVLTGIFLAAEWAGSVPEKAALWIAVGGFGSSMVFMGLDVRGYRLLRRSMEHLEILEAKVWQLAGLHVERTPRPEIANCSKADNSHVAKNGRRWSMLGNTWKSVDAHIITHRFLYRTSYLVGGVAWLSIILAFLWNTAGR